MKKYIITLGLLVVTSLLSSQDLVPITSISGGPTTDVGNPAAQAIDGQTQSSWRVSSGNNNGWVELHWASPQLIAGIDWQGTLAQGSTAQLWYSQNGSWKPFLSGRLDNSSPVGWVDLSLDEAVATGLQWRLSGTDAASSQLSEINVKGKSENSNSVRLTPFSISASDNTLWFLDESNLIDGDTRTSWRVDPTGSDDRDSADTRDWWKAHRNRKLFGAVWGEASAILNYSQPSAIDLVKIYLPIVLESDVVVEALVGATWTKLGTVLKGSTTGWQRLNVAALGIRASQIRLRANLGWNGAVQVGEVEVWGRGNSEVRNSQSLLLSGPTDLTNPVNVSLSSDGTSSQRLILVTKGGTATSLVVELNGIALNAAKLTSLRGRNLYTLTLIDGQLWNGDNFLRIAAIGAGTTLEDVQSSPVVGDGRVSSGPAGWGDGLLFSTAANEDGTSVINLGGQVSIERLETTSIEPLSVSAWAWVGGTWVSIQNVDSLIGLTTDQLKLTIIGHPGEVRVWGSRVTSMGPLVKVFSGTEENGQGNADGNSKLIGWVSDHTAKVTVNGVKAQMKGNIFWVKVSDLRLVSGEEALIRIVAVDAQNRQGTAVVHLIPDAPDNLTLDQSEATAFTKSSAYTVSGKVSSNDGDILINGVRANLLNKKFSMSVPLTEGLNQIKVQWLKNNGKPKATIIRRVVRNSQSLVLLVDSPVEASMITQNTVDVFGRVKGVGEVNVSVNGKSASMTGGSYSLAAVALTEGPNTVVVKATDASGQTATEYLHITRDTIAPAITLIQPANGSYAITTLVPVTVQVTEPNSSWVKVNDSAWTAVVGGVASLTVPLAEGPRMLSVTVRDAAGNQSSASANIIVDVTSPLAFAVTANPSGWTPNTRPVVTFATSDPVSGIDHYRLSLDGGNSVTVTSPYKLPTLSDGKHLVVVTSFNRAGLSTSVSTEVYVDTTAPKAVLGFNTVPGSDFVNLSWVATPEDGLSYRLERQPAWTGGIKTLTESDFADTGLSVGSTYKYRAWAVDHAGNVGNQMEWVVVQTGKSVDQVYPTEPTTAEYSDAKMEAPTGSFDASVTQVTIQEVPTESLSKAPENPVVSLVYEFQVTRTLNGVTTTTEHADMTTPVALTVGYETTRIPAGYSEADLKPFYYDSVWGRWIPVQGSVIDTQAKVVRFNTNHFSTYSVQATQAVDLSPQQLRDVQFSPLGTNKTHSPVTVSPEGGSVSTEFTELILPGKNGLDLVVKRTYDTGTAIIDAAPASSASNSGDGSSPWKAGAGWRLNFPSMKWNADGLWVKGLDGQMLSFGQAQLIATNDDGDSTSVVMENHEYSDVSLRVTFTKSVAPYLIFWTRATYKYDSAILTMKDGRQVEFDPSGRVVSIWDGPHVNSINFTYGETTTITDSLRRVVTVKYENGLVKTIGATGGSISYPDKATYTITNGRLASAIDVGKRTWIYDYDSRNLSSGSHLDSIDNPQNSSDFANYRNTDTKTITVAALSKVTGPGLGVTSVTYNVSNLSYQQSSDANYKTASLADVTESFWAPDPPPATTMHLEWRTVKQWVSQAHTATYHFTINNDRLLARSVTVALDPAHPVRTTTYGYNFVDGGNNHQFYNRQSIVDDGRVVTTTNYLSVPKTRKRLSEAPEALSSGLSFGSQNATDEVLAYFGNQTLSESTGTVLVAGATLETQTQDWDTSSMRLKRNKTVRAATNFSQTNYEYDGWGNITKSTVNSKVGDRSSTTVVQKTFYTFGTENLTMDWPGIVLNEPALAHPRKDLLAASKTTISTPYGADRKQFVAYWYNTKGQLRSQKQATDIGWASTDYEYESTTAQVNRITGPTGAVTSFTYVYDFDKHPDQYTITTTLAAVQQGDGTSADQVSVVTYNRLTGTASTIRDARQLETTKSYDWLDRVTDIVQPREPGEASNPKTHIDYLDTPLKTTVTSDNGAVVTYNFDNLGRLVTLVKSNSYRDKTATVVNEILTSTLGYDSWDEVTTLKGPVSDNVLVDPHDRQDSLVTKFTYDARGRVLSILAPGASKAKSITYDDASNTVTSKDELDNTSTQTLDWNGKVLTQSVILNGGVITSSTYFDSTGATVRTLDPNNNQTAISYNSQGLPIAVTAPTRNVIEGEATNVSPISPVLTKTYDLAGNLTATTQDLGGGKVRTTTLTVNSAGQVIQSETPVTVDGTPKILLTRTTYNPNGQKTAETTGYAHIDGSLIVDEEVVTKRWNYYFRGQVKSETDEDGMVTSYEYDTAGNRIKVTDPRGFVMKMTYDKLNRLVDATLPASVVGTTPKFWFVYDGRGNLKERTDIGGQVTRYEYTLRNQPAKQTLTDGRTSYVTQFTYDDAGRQTHMIAPNTAHDVETKYDTAGRVTQTGNSEIGWTNFTYDANGNRLSVTDGKLNTTRYTYTPDNQVETTTDAKGQVTQVYYDRWNQKTRTLDPERNLRTYKYDEIGRLISEKTPWDATLTSSYDAWGDVVSQVDANGTTFKRDYSNTHRLTQEIATAGAKTQITIHTYDEAGDLKSSDNGVLTQYNLVNGVYAPNAYGLTTGKKETVSGVELSMGYAYDNSQRLINVTNPDPNVDAHGVSYTYNTLGQLDTMPVWVNGKLGYDDYGRFSGYTLANNVTKTLTYDPQDRLGNIKYAAASTSLKDYAFTYDKAGNIATKNQNAYSYDQLNWLISADEKGWFQKKPDEINPAYGVSDRDYVGSSQLSFYVQPTDSVALDMAKRSVVVDLLETFGVNKIELHPQNSAHRVRERDLTVFGDNTKITGWTLSQTPDGTITLAFPKIFEARTLRIHTIWDDRNIRNESISTKATFKNSAKELVKVWALKKTHNEQYQYDAVGDRTRVTTDFSSVKASTYYKNNQNGNLSRVQSDGEWNYTYDGNGNRLTKTKSGENWSYSWGLHNELLSVAKNGTQIVSYTYDADNLRVKRVGNDGTTVYAYGRNGALTYQKNVDKNESRTFAYLADQVIGWTDTKGGVSTRYYATTDQLGSVTAITNANAQVVWSSEYNPFGTTSGVEGLYEFDGSYAGHQPDADTGLVYMWNRWQDPETGSFISEDPAQDGSNWYAYAGNSPLVNVDPTGLALKIVAAPAMDFTGQVNADQKPAPSQAGATTPTPVTPREPQLGLPDFWSPTVPAGQHYDFTPFEILTNSQDVLALYDKVAYDFIQMNDDEKRDYFGRENDANSRHNFPGEQLYRYGYYGGAGYTGGVEGDLKVTLDTFDQPSLNSLDEAYKTHDRGGFVGDNKPFISGDSQRAYQTNSTLVGNMNKLLSTGIILDTATKKILPFSEWSFVRTMAVATIVTFTYKMSEYEKNHGSYTK